MFVLRTALKEEAESDFAEHLTFNMRIKKVLKRKKEKRLEFFDA